MATKGDDKVVCSMNVNNEPERNFINVYKKFEFILNNKNETFTKKAESVVEVWQNLSLCKFENSEIQYIVQIIDWAKLHTLNIVLTGEWKKFKDQFEEPLLKEVKATQTQLTKINNAFFTRCQKLLDVIKNPWSDPTLEYLVRTSNAEIGPKEIDFFCVETAYLTSVRLKKLCESQCEDLALNLVKAFMKCYRLSQSESFNLNATETQVWFIFDIYVALLYKFKENDSLLDMLKGLSAEEGLNLIKRFSKKRVKISKVWKHCHRIAILASQVYISSTILKPIEEIKVVLKELLTAYVTLNNTDSFLKDVLESVRSIIRLAETAAHIYVFCEVFQEQFQSKMKAFIIELYIRALTTDMNLLERQKTDNNKEKISETTKQLASGFTNLAEVLKSDIHVSRECVMTAFSLEPTSERMKKIEELAELSGFEVLDTGQTWKCKLHPPVLPTDDVTWICKECGEYMCKPQLNVPLNTTNTALNEALTEEKLGITRELCDDLVVLLSSPRYQVFSWLLNWPDLQRLCLMYLNDPDTTKNVVTELKFLDIDYSIFASIKKEPLDEFAGIERGYEHYLDHEFDEDRISNVSEDTGSQDSRFYSMSSDSASELHCLPFGPKKSDPNTLKSLRMFRPNLKRSRPTAETQVPEKITRCESSDSVKPSSSKLAFPSSSMSSYHFPVSSIVGINSFRQESTSSSSSSPIGSIIEMNPARKDLPCWPFSNNGNELEKPFIPIKLHPPQYNNDVQPLSLIKPKELPDIPVNTKPPTQNLTPINLSPTSSKPWEPVTLPKQTTVQVEPIATQIQPPVKMSASKNTVVRNDLMDKPLEKAFHKFDIPVRTYSNNSHKSFHNKKNVSGVSVATSESSKTPLTMFNNLNTSVNDTHSKNGQVATLQQVGGQVAIENCSTHKLTAPIGNPNSSEAPLDQTTCNSSSRSSTIFKELVVELPKIEFATIKEDATAKLIVTEAMVPEDQDTYPSIDKLIDDSRRNSDSQTNEMENSPEAKGINKKPTLYEVPNLFEDLELEEPQAETPSQYVQVEIIEVEETKRDTSNIKSYVKKSKLKQKPKKVVEELNLNFLLGKQDESVISIDDTNDGYADTLINSDSEYDCFSSTNPLLHNVLNKIDSYENMRRSRVDKENRYIKNDSNIELNTKLMVSRELKYKEAEYKNRLYLKKEPKYESCPDTGSDSQVELDSDDQYNRCYIELSRNNLLYDKIKGAFKNIDHYLNKCNNNILNDSPLKRGKKSKKACSSKKNKKLKTGNALDKTGLDLDSKIKPKKDVAIRDIRVMLNRLPADLCKSYLNPTKSENEEKQKDPKEVPTLPSKKPIEFGMKSPRVVLERLSVINNNYVRSVLANVPGLHDTELIRPTNTNMVVNVVQIAGGRPNPTVPVVNAQTSTQITPHIQRIGQPRVEKPQGEQTDNSETMVTSTVTSVSSSVKPSTSQPSTLINILSQQVIKPGQSSNCVKTRPTPLINIVSHQIIRPSNQTIPRMITTSAQANEQVNNPTKSEASSEQTNVVSATIAKNVQATVKSATVPTSTAASGAILQFICKSAALPKFQQAFGKTVYQPSSTDSSDTSSTGDNSNAVEAPKKAAPTKNSTVNIQPIQGSVIYTRQVPVGQTINLIPPGSQVFRIATSNPDQISLVKDTVIHSKMSALLTAALQSKKSAEAQSETEGNGENVERVTVSRPTLVQSARIVKPVIQIPTNVIRTNTNTQANLSSTTLEQLREFDMVYKQIKERSNTGTTPVESSVQSEQENSSQGISVTYLNQGQKFTQLSPVVVVSSYCNLQPAASPALSVTSQGSSSPCVTPASTPTLPKVSSKSSSKGKSLKTTPPHASKASPIPKPQQKPQEDEHTTQRIFDILAEYAEQLRNSPDLNNKPAPRRRSNPPTNPNHNSKRKKSSGSKKPSTSGSVISESDLEDQRTIGSEDSSCGVLQLSVKDDDAPQNQKTESNDSSSGARPLMSAEPTTNPTTRNLIIADSSVGEALKIQNTAVLVPGNYIMPVSMVKGGQQIAVVSGGSKILATVPARSGPNMLLFQSFLNQNRKPGMPTVKYSALQPLSSLSTQNLAGVSGQSQVLLPQNAHNLTAVTLGQPLTLKKVDDSDNRVNTELLLAIAQPRNESVSIAETSQVDGTIQSGNSIKFDDNGIQTNSTHGKVYTYQKSTIATPIATPVISQISHLKNDSEESHASTQPSSIITLNISPDKNKDDTSKTVKRVQSVLVTTCSSNGPMLSQTPPRYRKPTEVTPVNNALNLKGGFLHNGEKQKDETKTFQSTPVYFPNKIKKVTTNIRGEKELHQLSLQRKQAALDRELRLQKSLSEECEDLGVDEPSTSDLFPEADLLFDSNHSPSFDQTAHDSGRKILHHDAKDKTITLFSDDDNSSSLRPDFLFDSVQYQNECELQYEQSRQITNGQSNESGSSCEDTTLLQNCASMSDVTLNSPISPEFNDNPTTHMNKYKFKYSNRKKTERHKQTETWTAGEEVSSSEDTMCSEMGKMSHGPKSFVIKSSSCDEDEEFKFVRVSISKTDLAREEESCEELHYEDELDSPSGRGARRSVKKMCSCCNGSQGGNRKRPSPQSHAPAMHKKAFLNKKR